MFNAILVTGGLGFIGSHTVIELIRNQYNVIIIDNLSNSKVSVLNKIESITGIRPQFYHGDLNDTNLLNAIFEYHVITTVIHFAGLKVVSESIKQPLYYYQHNLGITINLLNVMIKHNIYNIIFSSSAAVYGSQASPVIESMQTGIGITNPYGKTKYMLEEIFKDVQYANPKFSMVLLRYFNPIGADPSGLIAEDPNGIPTNLMPHILKTASGIYSKLNIFGNDYDTVDGTCIRDFIHVSDLAKGHVSALQKMNNPGIYVYNLGTGIGHTVKQLVDSFQKVNQVIVPYQYVDRRDGDIIISYADVSKVEQELGWKAEIGIDQMCLDSWNSYKTNENL
jgi:UDP-glucose 4-epimerase